MDMLGQRFRPLPNSPRYGPKTWKQDSDGVWVEQEMTQEEKDFAALESTLTWASPHSLWTQTKPITEADAEQFPICKSYIDGFAMFPKVENINTSTPEGADRARKQEADWQERALRMHDRQTTLQVADKPSDDNALTRKFQIELERGD